MVEKKKKKEPGKDKNLNPTLDETLVTLQKSFSRLSKKTAAVPEEEPRALIFGPVKFELAIRVDMEEDHMIVQPEGEIALTLSGTIEPDIREVTENETDEKANSKNQPQK